MPPPILYRLSGGHASLLGWEKRADGWRAIIAWFEVGPDTFAIKRAAVIADDVRRIEGVDYSAVPRTRAPMRAEDQYPDDPYDPRSPRKESRAEARRRIDRAMPHHQEPNF